MLIDFYVCASSLSPFSLQQKAFGIQIEAASQTVLCFHLVCGWRGVVRLCFTGGWNNSWSGKVRRCNGVESVTSLGIGSSRNLATGLNGRGFRSLRIQPRRNEIQQFPLCRSCVKARRKIVMKFAPSRDWHTEAELQLRCAL